ncbi:50S ribosomal protein L15 [bacterium HR29]|jgi:large subunit ribosomal protein L15|nr:50S ribosomal protein L15 [bacterium HR29]
MSIRAHHLRPPRGATHARKRVGRGNSSGHGTYSGRGIKGQRSRSGRDLRPTFEGGQFPLTRKLARLRGFKNPFKVVYQPVNVAVLEERFEAGAVITPATLRAHGVIKQLRDPVKLLGDGEVTKPFTVEVHAASAAAKEKIERAGGTVRIVGAAASEEQA